MLPPNYFEVLTNDSYAQFIVSRYSSLPTKSTFLIYSNIFPYLDSSAHSKNKIALNLSYSVVTYYGVAVSPTLSIVFKMNIMCLTPDSIKFFGW